jgi:hypothetical protein
MKVALFTTYLYDTDYDGGTFRDCSTLLSV